MKWPEAGRRPSKREGGRDKLNEPKEKTRPSLVHSREGRDLWIKELRGWEKKGEKEEKRERKRGGRGLVEKEGGRGIKFPVKLYGIRCLERLRPEFPYSPPPSDSVVQLYHP